MHCFCKFVNRGRPEVPDRAPPFTACMTLAFAGVALQLQPCTMWSCLALGPWCAPRSFNSPCLALNQGWRAAPPARMVTADHGRVGRLVLTLVKLIPAGETLLRKDPEQFRTLFSQAGAVPKARHVNCRPHWLRRGGAAHHFGHHYHLDSTVLRGR